MWKAISCALLILSLSVFCSCSESTEKSNQPANNSLAPDNISTAPSSSQKLTNSQVQKLYMTLEGIRAFADVPLLSIPLEHETVEQKDWRQKEIASSPFKDLITSVESACKISPFSNAEGGKEITNSSKIESLPGCPFNFSEVAVWSGQFSIELQSWFFYDMSAIFLKQQEGLKISAISKHLRKFATTQKCPSEGGLCTSYQKTNGKGTMTLFGGQIVDLTYAGEMLWNDVYKIRMEVSFDLDNVHYVVSETYDGKVPLRPNVYLNGLNVTGNADSFKILLNDTTPNRYY